MWARHPPGSHQSPPKARPGMHLCWSSARWLHVSHAITSYILFYKVCNCHCYIDVLKMLNAFLYSTIRIHVYMTLRWLYIDCCRFWTYKCSFAGYLWDKRSCALIQVYTCTCVYACRNYMFKYYMCNINCYFVPLTKIPFYKRIQDWYNYNIFYVVNIDMWSLLFSQTYQLHYDKWIFECSVPNPHIFFQYCISRSPCCIIYQVNVVVRKMKDQNTTVLNKIIWRVPHGKHT